MSTFCCCNGKIIIYACPIHGHLLPAPAPKGKSMNASALRTLKDLREMPIEELRALMDAQEDDPNSLGAMIANAQMPTAASESEEQARDAFVVRSTKHLTENVEHTRLMIGYGWDACAAWMRKGGGK